MPVGRRLRRMLSEYVVTRREHEELASRYEALLDQVNATPQQQQFCVPPGHFYSPYPSKETIETMAARPAGDEEPLAIDFRERDQLELFSTLAGLWEEHDFDKYDTGRRRYFYENPAYSWSDGIVLHSMLRTLQPNRVLEVGSGYSSAMILDTIEHWLGDQSHLTCIDPHPELLHSLIHPNDKSRVKVLGQNVQDVEIANFSELEKDDVLFIDSSHVVKFGSDVNYLFFEVLPRLVRGVWVHFHDIFYPFDYPAEWLREGRAWQEAYLLQAFLMYNQDFAVRWYQRYMWTRHHEQLVDLVPAMANNPGGNIWLQKVS